LVKTNREQSLIVHALFGKWNLPGRLSARHGQAWAAASNRTATPEQFLRAFADPGRSQPYRGAPRRCDGDHIRIEQLRILVFNKKIAAFA
jgi:hypothetical protein